ncbi:hypothetical protein IE4872_PD02157 (plasmid) [Rhizobium gallicum]|uniref:Uncharacterized protein n=1 Tax=Rhizobium gallicum TaxID=56730 RepID=A0A1L5NXS4_9HYPH|nr:hypothetical protein IE4872_PD02157 [Rhizobium gallicum]
MRRLPAPAGFQPVCLDRWQPERQPSAGALSWRLRCGIDPETERITLRMTGAGPQERYRSQDCDCATAAVISRTRYLRYRCGLAATASYPAEFSEPLKANNNRSVRDEHGEYFQLYSPTVKSVFRDCRKARLSEIRRGKAIFRITALRKHLRPVAFRRPD